MNRVLLHRDIYMPSWLQAEVARVLDRYESYTLSRHVMEHAVSGMDRSHGYTLEGLVDALDTHLGRPHEAFEAELTQYRDGGRWIVSKVCIRIPYSDMDEACISIRPWRDPQTGKVDPSTATIVTAWLNSIGDSHDTLDRTRYQGEAELRSLGYLGLLGGKTTPTID